MAKSIRIPWLVDLKKVSDKAEVRASVTDAKLDRRFEQVGPLINRFLMRRVTGALTVNGKLLPAVAPRGDTVRQSSQAALRMRLDPALGPLWDDTTIALLAACIRGDKSTSEIGPAAQQAVGRLFNMSYVGNVETWAAARDLDDAIHSKNPLRTLSLKLTGKLDRSRKLLSDRVNGDRAGVHATGIAVHNLVRGLEHMRELWRREPRPSADEAVRQCLYAPETVLRQATAAGSTALGEVRPGTLVLYELDTIRERTPDAETVFMADTWAECPAVAFVPALLRAVWERANAEKKS
jgi:hypothetical protein